MSPQIWLFLSTISLFFVGMGLAFAIHALLRKSRFARACRDFHRQRERLEAKFVQLGLINAKNHVPRWTDCEFGDDVMYARSRATGELRAFVAVSIEGLEEFGGRLARGGDIIGNLRAGTAVFRFNGNHWETDGRAILSLTPAKAIRFYQLDLELVGQEVAGNP